VLNDLQAEFGKAPAAEERERQNAAQLLFLSCLHSERERERERERESRFLLLQCHTTPRRTIAPPPCLPLDIKDSLKEDERFF
jgi:hypothetical protein